MVLTHQVWDVPEANEDQDVTMLFRSRDFLPGFTKFIAPRGRVGLPHGYLTFVSRLVTEIVHERLDGFVFVEPWWLKFN